MNAKRVLLLLPWGDTADKVLKGTLTTLLTAEMPGCAFYFLEVGQEYKSACVQKDWSHGDYSRWPSYVANDKVAGVYRYDLLVVVGAEEMARSVDGGSLVHGWHIGPVNLKLIAVMHAARNQQSYIFSELERAPSLVAVTPASKIYCYKQQRGDRVDTHAIVAFSQSAVDVEVMVTDE